MSPDDTPQSVTLLDCTLRDGGYYNNWDFSRDTIVSYAQAMAAARVPRVEIGFRTLDRGGFRGPAAFSTDSYLESLDLPSGPVYGAMINGAELANADDPARAAGDLFEKSSSSPLDLVRIATHYREIEKLPPALDRLHELGYEIGLNLMQIAFRTEEEITRFAELASASGVEIAYIADSFGGMQPHDVEKAIGVLRSTFDGAIGCHMHNNMSLAFANTMAAIEAGATYADSTVLGMGRGPGNAQTEYLAVELTRRGLADIDVVPILPIVAGDFSELQQHYGWGANVYYFLSAAHGIHPTYIQEMTKDGRYGIDEIVAAVGELADAGGASFSRKRLEAAAADSRLIDPDGTWDASGLCEGRNVLIVGPGPQGAARREDIEEYIRSARPYVVSLNAIPQVDPALVDLYAICHPVRAVIDSDTIKGIDGRVVMPRSVQTRARVEDGLGEFLDYGIAVSDGEVGIENTECSVPSISNFPYALAVASAGGASEIQLTGFDGFDSTDPRQADMEALLRAYSEQPRAVPIVALTPTSYTIDSRSIYEPATRG